MIIEKRIIESLHFSELDKADFLHIHRSLISKIDFSFYEFNIPVTIENCHICELCIQSTWFLKGFLFKNNLVENYINYEMGGHNDFPINISHNIFSGFFNFFTQINFLIPNLNSVIFPVG